MTSTWRICKKCNHDYLLPIPYEQSNPGIRDLCEECIGEYQRENEGCMNP